MQYHVDAVRRSRLLVSSGRFPIHRKCRINSYIHIVLNMCVFLAVLFHRCILMFARSCSVSLGTGAPLVENKFVGEGD